MSSDRPSVFLDTMIVFGIYAAAKQGDAEVLNASQAEWRRVVRSLTDKAGLENPRFIISRPVFHEMMSHSKIWYDYVVSNYDKEIFKNASESINNEILKKASQYAYECRAQFNHEDGKLKSFDPLIAAYASEANGYVISENQRDFPESHFSVSAIDLVILKGKEGKVGRRTIFLLKSKS